MTERLHTMSEFELHLKEEQVPVGGNERRPHGSCPGSSGQTQRVEDGGAYAFQTQVPGRADLHGCLHPSRLEFSIMMAALGSMQL
ncbi:uncharacterized protein isoform X8 [Macaca fascicularis]|uniref:uncharacterized protein isoform X5 n=1 Tax=Macaca fascicularis TaxID=9541 RepID=UPI003D15CEB4